MKKIILTVFLSMMFLSSAYASEEIQLAAVIDQSNSSTLNANKKLYAIGDARSSGSFRYSTPGQSGSDYAILGIVAASLLAIIVEGGNDSTSNH